MGAITIDSIFCQQLTPPPPMPGVMIPFLGNLQEFRKSLYSLPDPSEMLLKLLSSLNVAMVPIRGFIELLELLFMIKDCIMAVPKSLLPPNPQPIFDCLKKLLKKLYTLIYYIPPLSYLRTLVGLAYVIVLMMDEIVLMLIWIDNELTTLVSLFSKALRTGDTGLMKATQCRATEVQAVAMNAIEVLKLIGPLLRLLIEPIVEMMPNPTLAASMADAMDFNSKLESIGTALRSLQMEALEPILVPLKELLTALITAENAIIGIYNVAGGIMGYEALPSREMPTTVNF